MIAMIGDIAEEDNIEMVNKGNFENTSANFGAQKYPPIA
jgi:hypothetical protein